MRTSKWARLLWFGVLAGVVIACNAAGSAATPSATTAPQVTTQATTQVPTEGPSTPTVEAGPPTEAPPTAIQGPAIAHLVAGQAFDLGYVHMVDANRGWGIGGVSKAQDHVFRTEAGGQTWKDVTPPEPAPTGGTAVAALGYFADATHAWIAYGPEFPGAVPEGIRVWSTEDGGTSWSYGVVSTAGSMGESFIPAFLDFADSQHGWLLVVLGGGMNHQYSAVYATNDGGKTWTSIVDPTTDDRIQSFEKTGMVFFDAQHGWLTRDAQGVESTPHVIATEDGGLTWTRMDLPAPTGDAAWFDDHPCGTYAPTPLSSKSLLVLVKCLDAATFKVEQDYLYSTNDGGQTWQSAALPAGFSVVDPPAGGLFFTSMTSGLVLGRLIYRTDDGGKTWSLGKQVNWDGQFSFVDINTGWAVARDANQVALVKTTDGGKTWQEVKPMVAP